MEEARAAGEEAVRAAQHDAQRRATKAERHQARAAEAAEARAAAAARQSQQDAAAAAQRAQHAAQVRRAPDRLKRASALQFSLDFEAGVRFEGGRATLAKPVQVARGHSYVAHSPVQAP